MHVVRAKGAKQEKKSSIACFSSHYCNCLGNKLGNIKYMSLSRTQTVIVAVIIYSVCRLYSAGGTSSDVALDFGRDWPAAAHKRQKGPAAAEKMKREGPVLSVAAVVRSRCLLLGRGPTQPDLLSLSRISSFLILHDL
jgi:hypothetical protein